MSENKNIQVVEISPEIVQKVILSGDLSGLSPDQKVMYVKYRCDQLGLDPAAKPFDLLTLKGKQVLYATAGCTQQLSERRKLSSEIVRTETIEGVLIITVKVWDNDRTTQNVGAVSLANLKGEDLANATMKAHTKAIRRTVLAHCGLGMMDETEIETIDPVEPRVKSVIKTFDGELVGNHTMTELSEVMKNPLITDDERSKVRAGLKADKSQANINTLYDSWLNQIILRADKEKAEIDKMKSDIDAEFEEDEKRVIDMTNKLNEAMK